MKVLKEETSKKISNLRRKSLLIKKKIKMYSLGLKSRTIKGIIFTLFFY